MTKKARACQMFMKLCSRPHEYESENWRLASCSLLMECNSFVLEQSRDTRYHQFVVGG